MRGKTAGKLGGSTRGVDGSGCRGSFERTVRRVQAGAVEYAFAVGPPSRGLRLAGALESVETGADAFGTDGRASAVAGLPLVLALVWAGDTTTAEVSGPTGPGASVGEQAVRGAAVAVVRHDVSLARAAEAVDAPAGVVADACRALDATNDESDPTTDAHESDSATDADG